MWCICSTYSSWAGLQAKLFVGPFVQFFAFLVWDSFFFLPLHPQTPFLRLQTGTVHWKPVVILQTTVLGLWHRQSVIVGCSPHSVPLLLNTLKFTVYDCTPTDTKVNTKRRTRNGFARGFWNRVLPGRKSVVPRVENRTKQVILNASMASLGKLRSGARMGLPERFGPTEQIWSDVKNNVVVIESECWELRFQTSFNTSLWVLPKTNNNSSHVYKLSECYVSRVVNILFSSLAGQFTELLKAH